MGPQMNASAMSFNQMPKLDVSPNASNNNNWSSASAESVNGGHCNLSHIQLPKFVTTSSGSNNYGNYGNMASDVDANQSLVVIENVNSTRANGNSQNGVTLI